MHFALTNDQHAIQESIQAFLNRAAGLERLRAIVADPQGWDQSLWNSLAVEMGYAGLMIPDTCGGSGMGAVEMALVLEALGRCLAVVPFFETAVLGVQTILHAGTEAQKDALLPGLADGSVKTALALADLEGRAAPEGAPAVLSRRGDGWVLNGEAGFVAFAHVADLLLVAARTPDARTGGENGGLRIVAVPADRTGIAIHRQPPLDLTRPFSRIRFFETLVSDDEILGAAEDAGRGLERALAVAAGLLAAEQTGGAAFCLATTVEYAQQRVQFGRKIGSFQAVKHELADMMVAVEAARSAAYYAAATIDHGGGELFEACSVAKSWCSDAYRKCAGEAIQLHGGIGFTWEHHAHLYFKRAWSSSAWLGDPASHRERIARLIGLDAPTTPAPAKE